MDIYSYMDAHREEAQNLLMELAQIPAPSFDEMRRAEFCRDWLKAQGARGVYIDEVKNVIYPVGCTETGPLTVFVAHSDVVFPDTETLPLHIADGRIYCPGIGDDTANAVALLMTAKFIAEHDLKPNGCGVLLVINAAEEGLGNLAGCRALMEKFGSRIREFVSFDSHDCVLNYRAVGSRRYRVETETAGGHSFQDFGRESAIAHLARLIGMLYAQPVPQEGKTTYNVGTVSGGTSVNTIAQHAGMLYEFRSDTASSLEAMERQFRDALEVCRAQGMTLRVTPVGERPCGAPVDEAVQRAMIARADAATRAYFGRALTFVPASTDCNLPLAAGIPSVCVGCYNGAGSHTREEYVEIASLLPGLKVAAAMIGHHFHL